MPHAVTFLQHKRAKFKFQVKMGRFTNILQKNLTAKIFQCHETDFSVGCKMHYQIFPTTPKKSKCNNFLLS